MTRKLLLFLLLSAGISLGQERDIKVGPTGESTTGKPELVIQNGHSGAVRSISFSPDGKNLASGSNDNTVKLWSVHDGRLLRTFGGHSNVVNSVSFSPDGKSLASGSVDKTIKIWEVSSGRLQMTLEGHSECVNSVSFSPDGKTLASGSDDYAIKLWEISSGKLLRTLKGHSNAVSSVSFSPDGKTLASGSADSTIKLWNLETGMQIRTLELQRSGAIWAISFSPNGKILASNNGQYSTINFWDPGTGKLIRTLDGQSGWVTSIAFSIDGKTMATGSINHSVMIWDIVIGKAIRSLEGHSAEIESVSFSPDGKTLASASYDSTIKLWENINGKLIWSLEGHSSGIESVDFAPDGRTVASGSQDHTIKLWDTSTGNIIRFMKGHSNFISSVRFSPDGKTLASASGDGNIILWNYGTGEMIKILEGTSLGVASVSFSPDGKFLVSGGGTFSIEIWNVETGIEIILPHGHDDWVESVSFSADGKSIASGSRDRTIKFFNPVTGILIRTLEGHSWTVASVCFSPDGKILASGSWDRTIKLWDVYSGRLLRTLEGHSNWVQSVSFSPDGKFLASGSLDNTIKLWSVGDGKLLRTLEGHSNQVTSVCFSPDGKTLASGSWDTTIKFWDVKTGKMLITLLPLDKEDWVYYTPEGYFDTSANGKKYIGWTVGMKNYSFELFWDEYYRPGLFSRVISGEKIEGARDLSKGFATPPDVVIRRPRAGESFRSETLQVEVEATDSGGGVRDMRLYHQGKLVAGTRELGVTGSGKPVAQIYEVPLMAGENIFRATAYSRDNIESYAYEVKIRSAVAGKKPNLFVLAIGLNQYENPKFKLDYSRQDAESILKFLTGQEGKVYEKVYPKALYDEQATRKNILDALKLPTRPEDVVVIYLAGHGVAIDGRYYFLPYELPDDQPASLTKFGVSQAEIIGTLTSVEARKVMILLDSCHSGAVVLGMRGLEEVRATKLFSKTAGVHVFAASTYSQSALELAKLGHGLFTYTLLDGLSGRADENHDNSVLVSELSDFLPAAVKRIAEQWGKEQYPTVDMHGQDFPVSAY